jgi:hypothetical protein
VSAPRVATSLSPITAFAGGKDTTTLLSCCGHALLPLLPIRALLALRATCRDARAALQAHPLEDGTTDVGRSEGGLAAWHASFPSARVACCAPGRHPMSSVHNFPLNQDSFSGTLTLTPGGCHCLRGLSELRVLGVSEEHAAGLSGQLQGVRIVRAGQPWQTLSNSVSKRVLRELADSVRDPRPGVSVGPRDGNEADLQFLRGTVLGVEGSPWEGGVFFLDIRVPYNYPFKPPNVRMATKIFHPNITCNGGFTIDILNDQWCVAHGACAA